jgi:diguanylate cyclase (GGDEF)-like protein/PAS domain S-box-containing protein
MLSAIRNKFADSSALPRNVWFFGIATLALLVLLLINLVDTERERRIEEQRDVLRAASSAVAGVWESNLAEIEQILAGVESVVLVAPQAHQHFDATIQNILLQRMDENPELMDLLILDADGRIINWTGPNIPPVVSDRDYVAAHLNSKKSKLFIGGPKLSRVRHDRRFFGMSRANRDAAGNLRFISVAIVDLDLLAQRLKKIGTGNLRITVAEINRGTVYVRQPNYPRFTGDEFPARAKQIIRSGQLIQTPGQIVSIFDGVEVMASAHLLEGYPFGTITAIELDAFDSHSAFSNNVVLIGFSIGAILFAMTLRLVSGLTSLRNLQASSARQNSLLRALLDSIPDLIFFKDMQSVYLGSNKAFEEFVGHEEKDIIGKRDADLFPAEVANFFVEHDKIMLSQRRPRRNEEWVTYPDQRKVLLDTLKTPFYGPNGEILGLIGISRDITARNAAEARIRESEEFAHLLLTSTGEGIFGIDTEDNCTFCNPVAASMFGYGSPHDLIGQPMHKLTHHSHADGSDYPGAECRIGKTMSTLSSAHVEDEVFWRANGRCFPVEYRAHPIYRQEDVVGAVVTFSDISARKKHEGEVWQLANFDHLTGLANRHLFQDRLQLSIARAERRQVKFSLFYIDLDHFKPINDTYGHLAGDRVLIRAAETLRASIREEDTAARLGGDEFAVLVEDASDQQALRRLGEKMIRDIEAPVQIEGRMERISASIGIATYPDDGRNGDSLLNAADGALYHVKSTGRGQVAFARNHETPASPELL